MYTFPGHTGVIGMTGTTGAPVVKVEDLLKKCEQHVIVATNLGIFIISCSCQNTEDIMQGATVFQRKINEMAGKV